MENVRNKVSKISYSCTISKQNVAILPAKIQMQQMMMNQLSITDGLNKVFEKLVSDRLVDHLEKCGLFPDFQYGFRFSHPTADLLTVLFDRIARTFNRSATTRALAFNISKASDKVWQLVVFTIIRLLEFQARYLVLFCIF